MRSVFFSALAVGILAGTLCWWSALSGIVALFVLVSVALTASRLLQSETGKMAVYKSLGFSSGKLRLSFALRFLIVVIIGTIIGMCLSSLCAGSMIGSIFRMFGIGELNSG